MCYDGWDWHSSANLDESECFSECPDSSGISSPFTAINVQTVEASETTVPGTKALGGGPDRMLVGILCRICHCLAGGQREREPSAKPAGDAVGEERTETAPEARAEAGLAPIDGGTR